MALILVALLLGGGYFWMQKSGENDAVAIAMSCSIPKQHVRYGSMPKSSFKGIWIDSDYAWCPPPDRDASIACARNEAKRRDRDFTMQLVIGECERFGAVE
jgi:hypothetical protein